MRIERQVYLLDPQVLPPETIAVTFAKTSRSPESFRQIASELSETKSAEFNEKWVVGYGHSSVAEHAVLHIAVENVSRLAVETLESNRLASYTEKSTRYQTWSKDAYHMPAELEHTREGEVFNTTCERLFSTYHACLDVVYQYLLTKTPPSAGETDSSRERKLRTRAIDACRFLLPAASLANLGMTINARALEHAIGKMLSSPLLEVREIGSEVKAVAGQSVPTLLKYADEIPYLDRVCNEFSSITVNPAHQGDWMSLEYADPEIVERVLAASLYREQQTSYNDAFQWVRQASREERQQLVDCLAGKLDAHTQPVRELENASFSFDMILDQGAYYEVKRHRMMMQTPQQLTTRLGYAIPAIIAEAGVLDIYKEAMETAAKGYEVIAASNAPVAAYLVPNGFNRRLLVTANLRSMIHFIKLRSASNAHFSVRRVAQRMAEEISSVVPELEAYLGRNEEETSRSVETAFFHATNVMA